MGNLEIWAQEPNVTSHVYGFAGKHSWRLVSCKGKLGLLMRDHLRVPDGGCTYLGFRQQTYYTSCCRQ